MIGTGRCSRIDTYCLVDDGPLFLTDCFIDGSTVDQIVSKTLLGIEQVRQFGIRKSGSLSNFGSSNAPSAQMRQASEILRERLPDVEIDGEMHSQPHSTRLTQTIFDDTSLKVRPTYWSSWARRG